MIPGLAYGMISMREGEIRTLYIHPVWASQSDCFDPGAALEITVQLLKILPIQGVALPAIPVHNSFHADEKELEELRRKDYYVLGWKLWDHLRWGIKLFSKEELVSALKDSEELTFDSEDANKIHWLIYQQQMDNK